MSGAYPESSGYTHESTYVSIAQYLNCDNLLSADIRNKQVLKMDLHMTGAMTLSKKLDVHIKLCLMFTNPICSNLSLLSQVLGDYQLPKYNLHKKSSIEESYDQLASLLLYIAN